MRDKDVNDIRYRGKNWSQYDWGKQLIKEFTVTRSYIMSLRIHGRTQIAILFMSIATIIFVLHQMFSNIQSTGESRWKSSSESFMQKAEDIDYDVQSDDRFRSNYRNILQVAPQLSEPFPGKKIIHLDLKGASPLISYYKELFPYIKKLGATGLLIEYEDMYPYFENVTANNAFNYSDITTILDLAESNALEVIPLVQTFGHLEFVLKLEKYRELREVDRYPQVICPSHEKSIPLLQRMVDQMLALHPNTKYIHIGNDEVYYIGKCQKCTKVLNTNDWSKTELFLNHVKTVAEYINRSHPGVRPIVWDDEFRSAREDLIKDFGIPDLVDIMIWKYTPNVKQYIKDDLLEKYSRLFKSVWIASAFKGATGINQIITDPSYHLKNHVSWMEIVSKWKNQIEFKGIAITGWQRYDHFALLCELLPVAIPSLTINLQYLKGTEGGIHQNTLSEILQCDFPMSFPPMDFNYYSHSVTKCNFPGSMIYHLVNKVYIITDEINRFLGDTVRGSMSHYHIIQKFASPALVQRNNENIDHYRMELKYLDDELRKALAEVYDEYTISEWMLSYVTPLQLRIETIYNAREALLDQYTWPKRPLPNDVAIIQDLFNSFCNVTRNIECGLLSM